MKCSEMTAMSTSLSRLAACLLEFITFRMVSSRYATSKDPKFYGMYFDDHFTANSFPKVKTVSGYKVADLNISV